MLMGDALERIEEDIQRLLEDSGMIVGDISIEWPRDTGSVLRPVAMLLAACFGDRNPQLIINCAVAVEISHLACLTHSDLQETHLMSRSLSANDAERKMVSYLMSGDYLLSRSFMISAELGSEPTRILSLAARDLYLALIEERSGFANGTLDEPAYMLILDKKATSFFKLACQLAVMVSRIPQELGGPLIEYGRSLGMALQLRSEASRVDGWGAVGTVDALVNVLRSGAYLFPIVQALSLTDGGSLRDLRAIADDEPKVKNLVSCLMDAVDSTYAKSRAFLDHARNVIAPLPDGLPKVGLLHILEVAGDFRRNPIPLNRSTRILQ
jgi:geranylgeranyl pyrophosphate synthase